MNDDDLWEAMDRSIFGTNDPDTILAKVPQLEEEMWRQASSLGNYLRSLRESRLWELDRMASEASVSVTQWKSWEDDQSHPTWERLQLTARTLGWGNAKQKRLRRLLGETDARNEEVS